MRNQRLKSSRLLYWLVILLLLIMASQLLIRQVRGASVVRPNDHFTAPKESRDVASGWDEGSSDGQFLAFAADVVTETNDVVLNQIEGPAGVSSGIALWLKADAGVFSDNSCTTVASEGGAVGCWQDQSGNSNHATNASNNPTYQADIVNGLPVIRFNGTNQYLEKAYESTLNPNELTVIGVWRVTGGNGSWRSPLTSRVWPSSGYNFYATTANTWQFWLMSGGGSNVGTQPAIINEWKMIEGQYDGATQRIYVQGLLNQQKTSSYIPNTTQPLRIGAGFEGSVRYYFNGEIAEVLIYGEALDDIERSHIELYLANKYNLALNGAAIYSSATHNVAITGISQGANLTTSGDSDGLTISNQSFLSDTDDLLIFGHNVGDNSTTTDNLPTEGDWAGDDDLRWTREWECAINDASGHEGGQISFTFDFSEAGMNGTPQALASNYRLLKRNSTSDPFSELAQGSQIVEDQIIFENVESTNWCSFLTLGAINNAPLAVQLASFSAASEQQQIRLHWETVSELNTLGFNLYRATTASLPPELGGRGTEGGLVQLNPQLIPSQAPGSGQGAAYEWLDEEVEVGVTYYYWLEDVDVSGHTTRYGAISATVSQSTAVIVQQLASAPNGSSLMALVGLLLSIIALVWGRVWRGQSLSCQASD